MKKVIALALVAAMVVGGSTLASAGTLEGFYESQIALGEAQKAAGQAAYEAGQASLAAFYASQLSGIDSVAAFQAKQAGNTSVAAFQAAQKAESEARWAARYAALGQGVAINVD